jgi:tetratricopeptide (TPR) repeat protein
MLRKFFGKSSSPSEQALELAQQGVSAFQKGNIETAISYYDKALEIEPQLVIAYVNRGHAYFKKGDLAQAIEDATKAIEINPEVIEAYGVRGDSHFQKENYDQAIADYSKAIELNPQLAGAYRRRAEAYHSKGQLSRALADYETYLSIAPDISDQSIIQRRIDYLKNHSEQALELIQQGVSAFDKGNIDTAISYYDKALEIEPQLVTVYVNRGYAYFKKGDLAQAIEDATKAIEINPEAINAYGVRGDSHYLKENYDQAIADYSKAIELNPQLADAYRKRAEAYHSKGQLSRALADYETYLSIAPDISDQSKIQGRIDYLKNHWENDGDVDFSPRMPKVDPGPLRNEVLRFAQNMAADQNKRQLIIVLPGRNIKTSNTLPARETLLPEFVSMLEEIAPSSKQWNIIAIGMTELRAFNVSPLNCVPFLDLLHGLVQIGHAVILFEGHSSVFAQMCQNRDLLIVDSEMIPFLLSDWLEIARSTMRKPNILKVNRKGMTVLGTQKL